MVYCVLTKTARVNLSLTKTTAHYFAGAIKPSEITSGFGLTALARKAPAVR